MSVSCGREGQQRPVAGALGVAYALVEEVAINPIRDPKTPSGKSDSVSCGVTAPFSWVLVHKVLFVPFKSLFPSPV